MGDKKKAIVDIVNKTKHPLPKVPFVDIATAALGSNYELSLVFVGNTLSKKINNERRNKNYPTNILSFALDKTSGEIFIDLDLSRKEAPSFDRSYTNFIAFLFIHGLLHLKGFDHGSTMERNEKRLRQQFDI